MGSHRGAWFVAAAALAACGGDAGGSPLVPDGALAALSVIDTNAERRPLTAAAYTEAHTGEILEAGDTLRTDRTGFAEVIYGDGSLTRLDVDTELTVIALAGDVTVPEIEVRLDAGRVWNRVNTVTGSRGAFEVETSVGVAAVRGTAFSVDCPRGEDHCTFTVVEGEVVVTTPDGGEVPIAAGDEVTLGPEGDGGGDAAGGGEPAIVPVDLGGGGDGAAVWLARNTPIDGGTGRFSEPDEACAVTVDGRNLDHARTPATAIQAPVDATLAIDAVATGDLETYRVDLAFAGLRFRAAEGEILPDRSGDRSTFRGAVDVDRYAHWGVGLYEVTAETTGVRCQALAFVNVTGRHPLTTATGLLALLLVIAGLTGIAGATRGAWRGGGGADGPAGDGSGGPT